MEASKESGQGRMNTQRSTSPKSLRYRESNQKDRDWRNADQKSGRCGVEGRHYTINCFATEDHDAKEACINLMRCSFCREICPPENLQVCVVGHLTCSACMSRVVKCTFENIDEDGTITLCLTTLSVLKLSMYDYVYETLDATFRCGNWKHGCLAILRSDEMRLHRMQCNYRPEIGCPFTDCEIGEMTCEGLIRHLTEDHDSKFVTTNSQKTIISFKSAPDDFKDNYSWTPAIFQFLDYHFLLTMLQKAGRFYMWFYRLERKKPRGDNHSVEMRIEGNDPEVINRWEYVPRDFRLPFTALNSGMYNQSLDVFMRDFVKMNDDGKNLIHLEVKVMTKNQI